MYNLMDYPLLSRRLTPNKPLFTSGLDIGKGGFFQGDEARFGAADLAAIVEFRGTVANGDIDADVGAMPGIFAECEVNSVVKHGQD